MLPDYSLMALPQSCKEQLFERETFGLPPRHTSGSSDTRDLHSPWDDLV